ncbi:MAG TPA: PIG-L family deacetylase [Bryobacteraceae bacterium]|nr:PIG-L family deacetylase [Bryobacteraceae bacterium]
MRTHSAKSLALLLGLFLLAPAFAQAPFSGTPAIEQSLEKLTVLGSVLMIAAHPDDENTAILAYYARGRHMRTGYLSLTRGEGGQNLIGPEQGDLLGLIRSQELLAARRIDGAEQFFTRAIDFGYTKTPEETFAKWGHELVLSDVVWVIRSFRPDVVILRFSGTPKDGHGQHQVSAIVGKEAFFAAGDPSRFPEQLKFVQTWKARRLLFNSFSFTKEMEKEAAATPGRIEVDTGAYNPVLGVSYSQIAGMSRSMHRSQGMGASQRPGPSKNFLVPLAGDAVAKPPLNDAFDGIDTTWERVPGGAEIGRILEEAVRTFQPDRPERTIPLLLKAHPLVAALHDPWESEKLVELNEAIALCSGLWLDANAENYAVVPGATVDVGYTALNRSPFPLTLDGLTLEGMGGESHTDVHHAALASNQPVNAQLKYSVPAAQPYSQPFWLREPKQGDTYSVSDQRMVGLPEDPPLLSLRFGIEAGGVAFDLVRPVRHRYVDRVDGEQTRALTVVPPVALNVPQDVVLFPNGDARKVEMEVRADVPKVAGDVRLALGAGWNAQPMSRTFEQAEVGQQQPLTFEIKPDRGPDPPAWLLGVARVGERQIGVGMLVISHPPLPPLTVFPPAKMKLVRTDVRVTAHKVGYVMGAGDEMPDAIRQLGCEVTLLSASDLEQRDLSAFDAIVTGVRAYNTRADLRVNLPRLLDYVRNGGRLIDQYNVTDGNLVPMGPYPFKVGHERVTVEEAPVTFTNLSNPLLSTPNEITQKDFDGWIQERGLYFATEWDPRYQTVFESHDPGEKPLAGGMLYTHYGKGVYIFSGYAWFRELPAGVPGAYRLFANMLSAK